jgi:putative colanic acid biosynthesis UDP-glucose lipid carrier transferase
MTAAQSSRYSKYIRPISIVFDLFVIAILGIYFFEGLVSKLNTYILYLLITWSAIAFLINFYEVFRFTTPVEISTKILKQCSLFSLLIFAYYPFTQEVIFNEKAVLLYVLFFTILISIFKFLLFYYLKKYRIVTGSNYRNIVIIGHTEEAVRLKELFEDRIDYGYRFLGYYSNKSKSPEISGSLEELKIFILNNKVDEIFSSLEEMTNDQTIDMVEFADTNNINIKFIPGSKEIFSKNLKINYLEMFPVLTMQKTILHEPSIKTIKRTFDIVFSLLVIIFLLSWIVPILAILIKLESKGPVFFKQKRNGLNYAEFSCYKFRSMRVNEIADVEQVSKNDPRITKIGKFIRKTSMDELPQFFNAFLGTMSVVGPRPHMVSHTEKYAKSVDKFMVRHFIKPGITGLAQTNGFRGEIESERDIINRVKYDIFYLENWSLLLDLKIILLTVFNAVKGEKKAY